MIPPRLALIGFPCSGKSTLGHALATALNYTWLDSDQEIIQHTGQSIADLFAQGGEAHFRHQEGRWLETLPQRSQVVISTGGGLPCFYDHLARLQAWAYVIWLAPDFETLYQRLQQRPEHTLYGRTREQLESVYQQRIPFYQQADLIVTTVADPELLTAQIVTHLQRPSPGPKPVIRPTMAAPEAPQRDYKPRPTAER